MFAKYLCSDNSALSGAAVATQRRRKDRRDARTTARHWITAAWRRLVGVLVLLGLLTTDAHPATLSVLASFNGSNGRYPDAGSLTLIGDSLFGATFNGGTNSEYGTVFSLPVSGGSPTVLASFNGSNGANPNANLLLSGNILYGTTGYGGATAPAPSSAFQ